MYKITLRLIGLVASKPYLTKAFVYSIFFDGPRATAQRVANKLNGFQQNFRSYRFSLSKPSTYFPPDFLTAYLVAETVIDKAPVIEIHKYQVSADGNHVYQDSFKIMSERESLGDILNKHAQKETSEFLLVASRVGTSADLITKIGDQVFLNKTKASAFYFDSEVKMTQGNILPHFRTGFSIEYLLSNDFVGNAIAFDRQALLSVGGFSPKHKGYALLTDILFKFWISKKEIFHVPEILQRERVGDQLFGGSSKTDAIEVRQQILKQMKVLGTVRPSSRVPGVFEIKPELSAKPLVSIIIPFKDGGEVLKRCFASVFSQTKYPRFEVVAVDNNSCENQTFDLVNQLKEDSRFHLLEYKHVFNYSAINNFAVEKCHGEFVILLNSDTEILSPDWIESLLHYSMQEGIGAVGGLLLYPDRSIEHAGVIIGLGGVAGHSHRGMPSHLNGYFSRPYCAQEVSALTAACLMVKKTIYQEIGGLNEKDLGVLYNDVDFCLRLRRGGYRNIYNPRCEAIHYESRTRGHDFSFSKINRRHREIDFMLDRYSSLFRDGDPFYSPHLGVEGQDFELKRGSIYCGRP
ncbi:MAG: glycosyltransferase [Bdellovibrionales bacterium]|nr:glycosyltransferase [Bdellovibrionales bacterium]